MRRFTLDLSALTLAATLGLASAQPLLAADPHAHGQGGASETQLTLDNGKKWATDVPLRLGMTNIRTAVAAAPQAVHAGKAKPEAYAALGKTIESQVAHIVAECKLEPRADAVLHLVIADMLAGAEILKSPAAGQSPREGVLKVAAALDAYGEHFDHLGWKPLAR